MEGENMPRNSVETGARISLQNLNDSEEVRKVTSCLELAHLFSYLDGFQ